ncbi:unnamed protein product [Durusdinium trenchii]|uniref:Uncharacterized protein n=1 Tax=Durusdinium trenchii TaxID=1381693 RepID=A0ABP0SDX7_9DINO
MPRIFQHFVRHLQRSAIPKTPLRHRISLVRAGLQVGSTASGAVLAFRRPGDPLFMVTLENEESVDTAVAAVFEDFSDGSASWVSPGHVQRMVQATEGNVDLAIQKLKEAVAWKRDTLDGWLSQQAKDLPTAETRVIAIGQDSRPLVYSGCVNQRKGEVAAVILACVWHQALEKAGPMTQLDYVLDAHGYQPLLNLNMMPYLRLAERVRRYMMKQSGNVEPERRTSQEKASDECLFMSHMHMHGHHFAGSWCASIEAATSDACERVLWYFGIGARDASAFRGVLNAAGKAAEQPPPQQLVQSKDLAEDNSPGGVRDQERTKSDLFNPPKKRKK